MTAEERAEIVHRANLLVTAQGCHTVDGYLGCPMLLLDFEGFRIIKYLHVDRHFVVIRRMSGPVAGAVLECDVPMTQLELVRSKFRWGPASVDIRDGEIIDKFLVPARKATLLDELGATQE